MLVTLSPDNSDEATINCMIEEIKELNPHGITLLRLMPVGRQTYIDYPRDLDKYNPMDSISKFREVFGEKAKLHCAFRANLKDEKRSFCNMLHEKLGVDHRGNVYACAWAGYLPVENNANPFYLGNLLETDIDAIFKSRHLSDLRRCINESKNDFCRIFSYCENKEKGMVENYDQFHKWHDIPSPIA